MTSYINVSYNHFSAIQRWANEVIAQATLDLRDFTVEVKHRGRYYRLYPMFQAKVHGRLNHLRELTPDVRGFGGWRPYQTLTHPYSTDKKLFKAHVQESGLRVPAGWEFKGAPPKHDYVLKASRSSFGLGLFGPYRAGQEPIVRPEELDRHAEIFAEQFIHGRMLKVWYWGAKPFFAHVQEYPAILGDGRSTVAELLQRKVLDARLEWESFEQKPVALDCLAFQGLAFNDCLRQGQSAWIDFRYEQLYSPPTGGAAVSDNRLEALVKETGEETQRMGVALARLLRETIPLPVIITVDGVLDDEGRIWWLEMNTNSLLPPEGYAVMFSDLFA